MQEDCFAVLPRISNHRNLSNRSAPRVIRFVSFAAVSAAAVLLMFSMEFILIEVSFIDLSLPWALLPWFAEGTPVTLNILQRSGSSFGFRQASWGEAT